jgi:hypothetical protein
MKNEWLVVSEEKSFQGKDVDVKARLSDIMSQIDEGKGWRFSEEQAKTLAKLVGNLTKQVKANTKKRNEERKRLFKIPFFKIKVSR